jgi:GNAT superfamily N-acetyltransferase
MILRAANEADVPAIVGMAGKFYPTTHYPAFAPFDVDAAESLARLLIADGVMLVAELEGQVVGMVGLLLAPFLFNPTKRVAYEAIWWVEPEAQGAGIGKALLGAIDGACKAKGADGIQMIHLASSPPQAGALYERLGYASCESAYFKEV